MFNHEQQHKLFGHDMLIRIQPCPVLHTPAPLLKFGMDKLAYFTVVAVTFTLDALEYARDKKYKHTC